MNAIQDIYPSRQNVTPGHAERQDPVVWGDAKDGPLSAEEISFFDRNGYLWLSGLIDVEEVARLKQERYQPYRDQVLAEIARRFHQIPAGLPVEGNPFCERYGFADCAPGRPGGR